jgi:glucosylceramidase
MLSDGYQAYDFLSVFYPMVKKAFPNLAVSCCDSTGARQQRTLLYELGRLGGLNLFDINTYHNYQSDIKEPFDDLLHGQPTIETEWSDGGSTWTPTWDVSGNNFEGFQWAIYMHNAFRNNVAGWSHWWCAFNGGDAALVNVMAPLTKSPLDFGLSRGTSVSRAPAQCESTLSQMMMICMLRLG